MRIEADFLGEDLVAAKIHGIAMRALDLRPAWGEAVETFRRAATRQFQSQGVYGSGGWSPLAPSTLRQKLRAGLDPRILVRSRKLMRSVTGGPGELNDSNEQLLLWGTKVSYAGFHQHGTRNMPRRRVMQLPVADRKQVVRAVHRRIMTERGRA